MKELLFIFILAGGVVVGKLMYDKYSSTALSTIRLDNDIIVDINRYEKEQQTKAINIEKVKDEINASLPNDLGLHTIRL